MSTTFGVEIKNIIGIEKMVEVAFRSNGIRFTNELAHLLPDNTLVIAMDNSQQGIFTIGDIKNEIERNKTHTFKPGSCCYWRSCRGPVNKPSLSAERFQKGMDRVSSGEIRKDIFTELLTDYELTDVQAKSLLLL